VPAGAILLGRDQERGTLAGLIAAAGQGASGALVLHGEAGMGKTALLDDVAATTALPVARVETEGSSTASPALTDALVAAV